MSLSAHLLILAATIGQADGAPTQYVPKWSDNPHSLDLMDGEYRYTYSRKDFADSQAVSRDLVRWYEAKGPLRPVSKKENEMQLPLDGDSGKLRLMYFCSEGYWFEDQQPDFSHRRPPGGIAPLKVGGRYLQIVNDGLSVPPHEIRLVSLPKQMRLIHSPVRELDVLHGKSVLGTRSLAADAPNPLAGLHATHFDLQTKFRPGKSKVTFRIRGVDIIYDGPAESLQGDVLKKKLPLVDKDIELRILTSDNLIEVFANGGLDYINEEVKWAKDDTIAVKVAGDPVLFRWLDVFELRSPDVLGKGPAPDITKETFGVTPVAESKETTGFIIAGKNPTDSLARLTEIHGRKIAALERDMRPGAKARAGFLGDAEKLLDVLAEDNRTVVDKLGRSHTELALPLRILGTYAQEKATKEPIEFVYRGRRFQARAEVAKAHIESPFADDLSTNVSVTLWNLDNGKSLTYSMMVPHLIERYGFYEGHGTSYRVEPRDIVEVLELRH